MNDDRAGLAGGGVCEQPGPADDAVQETWLRLTRSDGDGADNLGAWLTTIVARVCLNMLRSRNTRQEDPLGVHLLPGGIAPSRFRQ